MFTKLAHVCLNVSNLDSSLNFYKSLGFKVNFVFTRNGKNFGAYLEIAPGSFVELFENPEQTNKENCGLAHFCLEAEDIDLGYIFIGSCTNARLSDLQLAARFVKGKKIAPNLTAIVVPGSRPVKQAAEKIGLDKIFKDAIDAVFPIICN